MTADPDIIEAKAITGHKDARMMDRYYYADAQKLGKKLLAAEAKRNEEALAKRVGSNQVSTVPTMEGEAPDRFARRLAVQLLEEAGLPVPSDLHRG